MRAVPSTCVTNVTASAIFYAFQKKKKHKKISLFACPFSVIDLQQMRTVDIAAKDNTVSKKKCFCNISYDMPHKLQTNHLSFERKGSL